MDLTKFEKNVIDFVNDIDLVFPEYKIYDKQIYSDLKDESLEIRNNTLNKLYDYCKSIYPKHFFDILYKNDKIFESEPYFIPEINFKEMWELSTSNETKTKIWQYLQLILMFITEQMENSSDFGEATQLFDLLDEDEFKDKLNETFEDLTKAFGSDISFGKSDEPIENDSSNASFFNDTFDPEKIHDHLSKLLEGKIGCLAKEIAGDTMEELGVDSSGNTQRVFESLIKDPSKLMMLMQKIGDKIENKIKRGEINKDELMTEASELFKNMKDMPGFEEMFNKMAKSHVGRKGGKAPSMNAMETMLEKNMRASKQRKQMLERLQEKKTQSNGIGDSPMEITNQDSEPPRVAYTDEEIYKSFMDDGSVSTKQKTTNNNTNKKKKKKKK